jgi:hypothetical protein
LLSYNKVIDKVMNIGLNRINNDPNMNVLELFKRASDNENRTVKIIIYDDPSDKEHPKDVFKDSRRILWSQGLAHKDGQIIKIDVAPYTVIYKITVSAWYRLIAQQNTFKDLYWSDKFDAEGDYFFRDLVVWNKFWEKYKNVVKLSSLEKIMLRDNKEDM